MTTRIKLPHTLLTRARAEELLGEIAALKLEERHQQNALDALLTEARASFEAPLTALGKEIEDKTVLLESWAAANPDEFPKGRKSIEMHHGTLGYRTGTPKLTLWREWTDDLFVNRTQPVGSYLMVIGLNPSTADETLDDPTIRRCKDFAKRWGFQALCMTNLFAWRATDPRDMKRMPDPVGPENDKWLVRISRGAGMILAAWGKHGSHMNRAALILSGLPTIHCLRTNKDGSPEHPLYVPAVTVPFRLGGGGAEQVRETAASEPPRDNAEICGAEAEPRLTQDK